MKIPFLTGLLALAACSSVPPGPPLPAPVRLDMRVTEAAFERNLEINVDESGHLTSYLRRSLLRDQKRSGQLSAEQKQELAGLLEKWTPAPPVAGPPWGTLQYGSKQTAWAKDAKLPSDLEAVVKYLRTVDDGFRLEYVH